MLDQSSIKVLEVEMQEIKIQSSTVCPNCGEKYSFYIDKEGKRKGILPSEYIHEGFFDLHYGKCHDCYSCGYKWKIRESKESLLVKLFPFLKDR